MSTDSVTKLQAQTAAHMSWANTASPATRTEPGRRAFLDRFERQVDPDGSLSPVERNRRAQHARKAYFATLAAKSAATRRRRVVVDRSSV
jgi:hypothetical protein